MSKKIELKKEYIGLDTIPDIYDYKTPLEELKKKKEEIEKKIFDEKE